MNYQIESDFLSKFSLEDWVLQFSTNKMDPWLNGDFSYYRNGEDWDIFGLLDTLLCMEVLSPSQNLFPKIDPQRWADRILSCFDEKGFVNSKNPTYHVTEHTTAYAYSGLVILAKRGAVIKVPSLKYNIEVSSEKLFKKWFDNMGFKIPRLYAGKGIKASIKHSAKRLGWLHFWPGSHVGGGLIAAITMNHLLKSGLNSQEILQNPQKEVLWFFKYANQYIELKTGLWRPLIKRILHTKPKISDYGGAAHFLWIYDFYHKKTANPSALALNALQLQNSDGFYLSKPFCIDLDFIHALVFAKKSISDEPLKDKIDQAVYKNFTSIVDFISKPQNLLKYPDSHGLPGALCSIAIAESYLKANHYSNLSLFTKNIFEDVCWI